MKGETMNPYERRIKQLEKEGLTTSNARAIADYEYPCTDEVKEWMKIIYFIN